MITVEDLHGKPRSNRNPVPIYTDAPLSRNVQDSMGFSDAFATARQEVGAGGVFVWRGNVYDTYYREEWEALSLSERAQYDASVHLETTQDLDITSSTANHSEFHIQIEITDTPEIEMSEDGSDFGDYQPII